MPAARPRTSRLLSLALVTALLFGLAGCATVTPISRLLDDPGRYDGQTVRVQGEVIGGVGGLGVGAWQVRDDTGTLTVISEQYGAPRTGARVTVKGIFQALITLGSRSLAVLREQDRSVR